MGAVDSNGDVTVSKSNHGGATVSDSAVDPSIASADFTLWERSITEWFTSNQ